LNDPSSSAQNSITEKLRNPAFRNERHTTTG
jgi:hypothetical protein